MNTESLLTRAEIAALTAPTLAALPDHEQIEALRSLRDLLSEAKNVAQQLAVIGAWASDRSRSLFERIYSEGKA